MRHYLFVIIDGNEEAPVSGIDSHTLTDDFEVAFDRLNHYAKIELDADDIRQPKKPGPFNITIGNTHLQIWETIIPDKN